MELRPGLMMKTPLTDATVYFTIVGQLVTVEARDLVINYATFVHDAKLVCIYTFFRIDSNYYRMRGIKSVECFYPSYGRNAFEIVLSVTYFSQLRFLSDVHP